LSLIAVDALSSIIPNRTLRPLQRRWCRVGEKCPQEAGLRFRGTGEECLDLGTVRNISVQRATILMAMAQSWDQLASQRDRYGAILIEEGV
jgi:hypothetical protein